MQEIKESYGVLVGLSDHTIWNISATTATSLGTSAIEKHFTISRADKGPDSSFSIEPDELAILIEETGDVWKSLGSKSFDRPIDEDGNRAFIRSLYFVENLKKGDLIKKENIRRIRPGYGLTPKYFDDLIGRSLIRDVERGDAVQWDHFKS